MENAFLLASIVGVGVPPLTTFNIDNVGHIKLRWFESNARMSAAGPRRFECRILERNQEADRMSDGAVTGKRTLARKRVLSRNAASRFDALGIPHPRL